LDNADEKTIRTSDKGWLTVLARAYAKREPVLVIDDAQVGIRPGEETLLELARRSRLSTRELVAVCTALGLSAAGIGMIVLAFVDPEPTSKLGLLVGGGAVTLLTGGLAALKVLVGLRPPHVELGSRGVSLRWE
jgi:hypothetical protein